MHKSSPFSPSTFLLHNPHLCRGSPTVRIYSQNSTLAWHTSSTWLRLLVAHCRWLSPDFPHLALLINALLTHRHLPCPMLKAWQCGCRLPLPTRPCPRPHTLCLGLCLRPCSSIVTPFPLRRHFCFFLTLFFIQNFLSVRHVTTCPPWLSYFIIFFASPHLSIHLLLPARRPHPLIVPCPRSVSIRYVVLPVATPPLLTASYSNSTLWPRI